MTWFGAGEGGMHACITLKEKLGGGKSGQQRHLLAGLAKNHLHVVWQRAALLIHNIGRPRDQLQYISSLTEKLSV